jgi:hypothetical protein
VASLELHVDLGERVSEAVSQIDETVVHGPKPSDQRQTEQQQSQQPPHGILPCLQKALPV